MERQSTAARTDSTVIRLERSEFIPARFEHKWVPTKNERNLQVALEVAQKGAGEGVLVEIVGNAGRGKTRTIRRYASHHESIYLLCIETWKRSELPMLQALCRELGILKPPGRANDCFLLAAERLIDEPRIVFLDEIDLVPKRINLIRQLSEVVGGIFVLIGEEETLSHHMTRNERVWSRTFQTLHFEPISVGDIIIYCKESGGIEVTPEAAVIMHQSPGGKDWRVVKRITIDLVEIANAHRTRIISEDMARQAIKLGLKSDGRKVVKGAA